MLRIGYLDEAGTHAARGTPYGVTHTILQLSPAAQQLVSKSQ